MVFYKNWFGSSKTLPKPRKAFRLDSRIFTRIYQHHGESTQSFKWTASRINFMSEMMKMFPEHEVAGYAGADTADFAAAIHKYGQGEGSPFFEGEGNAPQLWTGEGPAPNESYYTLDDSGKPIHPRYNDAWDDNGWKPYHGYTREHFGADHRAPDPRTGLPWGFFQGKIAQNVNFYSSAGEFNHFQITGNNKYLGYENPAYNLSQTTSEGWNIEDALSASAYDGLFFSGVESYSDIWSGAKGALNLYGNLNYYDIVMSGFNNGAQVAYGDLGQPGVVDGERVKWAADSDWNPNNSLDYYQGKFAYDGMQGTNGEGAFKLMLGLLESRRRIFFASYEIFGPTNNICDKNGDVPIPNDQEMIAAFDSWNTDPSRGGGADPHNLSLFSLFLYAQHSLHSIMPLYSIPETGYSFDPGQSGGGLPGWMFSGKDQLAFIRFGQWMNTNLNTYKNSLSNGDYKTRVSNLINEFRGEGSYTAQPYINTIRDGVGDGSRAGWDRYSSGWWDGDDPANANPRAADGPHRYYTVSQLKGINLATDRIGNVYDQNGVLLEQNLGSRNWAVHHVLSLLGKTDQDIGRILSIRVQNRRNSTRYRQEMKDWHETKMDLVRQEIRDEGMARKRRAEHKKYMAMLAGKKKQRKNSMKGAGAGAIRNKISAKIASKKRQERQAQQGKKKKKKV